MIQVDCLEEFVLKDDSLVYLFIEAKNGQIYYCVKICSLAEEKFNKVILERLSNSAY